MSSSAQIRQRIADVLQKRSKVDGDISAAEQKKAAKEAEANDKVVRASKTSSGVTAKNYLRQADSARKVAIAEGKKIAAAAKKRADLSKEEARLNKALTAALAREALADKRSADKDRRAREDAERKREAQRRADERQRQQEKVRAEQRRWADRADTHSRIDRTEERLAEQIAALGKPKNENLRILYATASPEGELRVAQEIRRVKNAVASALHRDVVEIEHAPDVTAADLLNYLTAFQPHVIHFSGHANEDVLVFDDGGTAVNAGHEIPIELFMRAVSSPDQRPALVVLNACESATNLEPLLAGVPIAIGMSAPVGDTDAITFATRFYRSVADGQSIESALAIARVDMELNGLPDHNLPTLIAAPGIDAGAVRLVLGPKDAP